MAIPMIDDFELKAVQQIHHEIEQDFARHAIPGLEGTFHQKLGRRSHRVALSGFLLPAAAADDLKTLQQKASSGAEVTFSADITTALEIDKMVIESFRAGQEVGPAGQIAYTIILSESPPLPPPAEVSGFDDLGFDAGALGDIAGAIADQAGALAELADAALGALEQLEALASLGNLASAGNPVKPVADTVSTVRDVSKSFTGVLDSIRGITG